MVTGSRAKYWSDPTAVKRGIVSRLSTFPRDTLVMQGGADGVDAWTKIACEIVGLDCRTFRPDKRLPSPQRYHARNDEMLDLADQVLAIWDGRSPGTKSVIDKARRRGITLWVANPERPSSPIKEKESSDSSGSEPS